MEPNFEEIALKNGIVNGLSIHSNSRLIKEKFEQYTKDIYNLAKQLNTFHFDCQKRDGKVKTKKIYAANKEDAKLLFKAKYPEYNFDEPYR